MNLINFRPGELQDQIQARMGHNTAGGTAKRDLARYYKLLDQVLPSLDLAREEASLICDALNGTYLDEHTYHLLWASIEDAVTMDHLDKKWGVDGPALVNKIREYSPPQTMALLDATERFWNNPNPLDEALDRAFGEAVSKSPAR